MLDLVRTRAEVQKKVAAIMAARVMKEQVADWSIIGDQCNFSVHHMCLRV